MSYTVFASLLIVGEDNSMGSQGVSRRGFLKGALATGGAAATATALGGCQQAPQSPNVPSKWDKDADVVVVGGGGTGCAAAISAAEAGAKVILLEVAPALGGSSALCVGSVTAPLSKMQKDQGIQDSIEDYMEDILHATGANASRVDKDMLQLLAETSGPAIDWLAGLGVQFAGPYEYPGHHRVNRMHMLVPNSAAWRKVLQPKMQEKGVEILLQTKGAELYRDVNNRVLGVKAIDATTNKAIAIKAKKAVILATASTEAATAYKKKITTPTIAEMPAANPNHEGSGLMMAAALGADLTMLDAWGSPGLRTNLPGPNVSSTGKQAWMPFGIMDAGAILVNNEGKRFVNEKSADNDMSLAVQAQTGKICHMVFDSRVAEIFNKWPMVVSSHPDKGDVSGIGGWGLIDDFVARDGIKVASTIEELAAAVKVEPAGLKATIEQWNNYCQEGKDPDFKRTTFGHAEAKTVGAGIKTPPFYVHSPIRVQIILADVTLMVNTKLQVLDVFGNVIKGLYAGGETGHGNLYLSGHGTHMAWNFASGRLAGTNAAAEES
ncbi:MAG: FAD-dependent oxidoreductase [Planctomycetota bacterium]|nr:FAD-dependent oxidoreductase [Planctomycetota bacterium]